MLLNQFLLLAAVLFCIGVYGVMARKNGVMVLLSIELILNAVNLNLVAFGAKWASDPSASAACAAGQPCPATIGQVFGLFVIAVAAAEVGVGLAIVLMLFRNRKSVDIDELDLMKG